MPADRSPRNGHNQPPPPAASPNHRRAQSSFYAELQRNIALMTNSVQHLARQRDDPRARMNDLHAALGPHDQYQYGLPHTPPTGVQALPSCTAHNETRPSTAPTPSFATPSRARSESLAPLAPSFERAVSPAAARGSIVPSRDASRAPSPFATPARTRRQLSRSSPYPGTPVPPRPTLPAGPGPVRGGGATLADPQAHTRVSPRPGTAPTARVSPPGHPRIVSGSSTSSLAPPTMTVARPPSVIDPRLLAPAPQGYASVSSTPNEHGYHLVVVRKDVAAALKRGISIPMQSADGRIRVTATTPEDPTPEEERAAIERAKAELEAIRVREEEAANARREAAAADALLDISTPRDASFGARIQYPPRPAVPQRASSGSPGPSTRQGDGSPKATMSVSPPVAPPLAPPGYKRPTKAGKMPRSAAHTVHAPTHESPASTTSSLSPVPQILSPHDSDDQNGTAAVLAEQDEHEVDDDDEDDEDDGGDEDGDEYVPPGRRRAASKKNGTRAKGTTKSKSTTKRR